VSVKHGILLNPGLTISTDSTHQTRVAPVICSRETEFSISVKLIATDLTWIVAVRYPSPTFDIEAPHDALYAVGYRIYPEKIGGTLRLRRSTIGLIDADNIRRFLRVSRRARRG